MPYTVLRAELSSRLAKLARYMNIPAAEKFTSPYTSQYIYQTKVAAYYLITFHNLSRLHPAYAAGTLPKFVRVVSSHSPLSSDGTTSLAGE